VQRCDREANAFDGNGAFEDKIARYFRRISNPNHPRAALFSSVKESPARVNMALNYVSAKPRLWCDGAFKIYRRSSAQASKG